MKTSRLIILTCTLNIFVGTGITCEYKTEIGNPFLGYVYRADKSTVQDYESEKIFLSSTALTFKRIYFTLFNKSSLNKNTDELRQFMKKMDGCFVNEIENPIVSKEEQSSEILSEKKILDAKISIDAKVELLLNAEGSTYALEGHDLAIKLTPMVKMFQQVMLDEYEKNGIRATYGRPHTWHPLTKKEFPFLTFGSKLLIHLAKGVTSKYLVTGHETELYEEVIKRPLESITLDEMFRMSYRLHNGDVYQALLGIENLLSRDWTSVQRNQRVVTRRLSQITNYFNYSDTYGSWYHLFGIMLYGYVEGGLAASVVGNIETLGSWVLGGYTDEKQEDYTNMFGALVGAKLGESVKENRYLNKEKFTSNPKNLIVKNYLFIDEDFSKRILKQPVRLLPEDRGQSYQKTNSSNVKRLIVNMSDSKMVYENETQRIYNTVLADFKSEVEAAIQSKKNIFDSTNGITTLHKLIKEMTNHPGISIDGAGQLSLLLIEMRGVIKNQSWTKFRIKSKLLKSFDKLTQEIEFVKPVS